jgi:glutathione S-transferase
MDGLDAAEPPAQPPGMLKVWGRRNSANVQKVLWLIAELDLEHEHVPVGGPFGGLAAAEFRALNPNQLVPVLEDGPLAIWESHAILRYLAARWGAGRFWSADAGERSLQDRWMDWCQTTWQPAFMTGVFWGFYRTPEPDRNWPAIHANVELCGQLLGLVERQLEAKSYLTGETLALGDVPLATSLYRYFSLEIERPRLPLLEAWYARLQERAPYREHVMVPFDGLKGRLAF